MKIEFSFPSLDIAPVHMEVILTSPDLFEISLILEASADGRAPSSDIPSPPTEDRRLHLDHREYPHSAKLKSLELSDECGKRLN
jgi:hypothetical protein